MISFLKKHGRWLVPLLCIVILAPFTPAIDLAFAHYFYDEQSHSFIGHTYPLFDFLYDFGELPAFFVAGIASLTLVGSYLFSSWKKLRTASLALVLVLIVGAGIITNALLKEFWPRARPKHIEQFGGIYPHQPFYYPEFSSTHAGLKSFPSGHCAMGFYFFALALVGQRENKRYLTWIGFFIAFTLGTSLGIARMAQGGHFFSDVLAAALIMWWTSLSVCWLVYNDKYRDTK